MPKKILPTYLKIHSQYTKWDNKLNDFFESLSDKQLEQYYREMGKYLGFPVCCTDDFIDRIFNDKNITRKQNKVHKNTGFVPCKKHTNQILSAEINLEDSVQDRKCPIPFPDF